MNHFFKVNLILTSTLLMAASSYASSSSFVPNPAGNAMPCQKDMNFNQWLNGLKKEALSQGITEVTFENARKYLIVDKKVLAMDSNQGVFQQPFLKFSERMASQARINKARSLIQKDMKNIFDLAFQKYGVPAEVITAILALESDFGVGVGKYSVLSATTTLAYDCRRTDMFRFQLMHALKLLQRGDLKAEEMMGNWAGELGAGQFMPADYLTSGVDFNNDGRIDLTRGLEDTIGAIGNYFIQHGWQRGQPWMIEVNLPKNAEHVIDWKNTDPEITLPLSQWKLMGIKAVSGQKFPSEDYQSSLVLPMGMNGPAFITFPNMNVFRQWNSSFVYSTTLAYTANRIAGAKQVQNGLAPVTPLTTEQVIQMQNHLLKLGFNIGKADGKIGAATRVAVKQTQMKLQIPADGYPTSDYLEKMLRL